MNTLSYQISEIDKDTVLIEWVVDGDVIHAQARQNWVTPSAEDYAEESYQDMAEWAQQEGYDVYVPEVIGRNC
jgi:nucleotide-binding universal stress UspA family protein